MAYKTIQFEGFCGPTYLTVSPNFDAERAINLYPEPGNAQTKSKMMLVGRPGLSPTPFSTSVLSPCRALWAGNNRLFAAGGTHFYEMATGGGLTTDYGAMAGSTGKGPCQIQANGTELLVMDSGAGQIYKANLIGPAMTSVFNGVALEYLDGFYVAIATGASLVGTNPNQINVSNYLAGATWSALNYVLRTGSADLTTNLAVQNGLLYIFGQKSIEVWYNAGNLNFPFARVNNATIGLGLLAPYSVVKFYNTLMWIGADDRGYAQVYMMAGTNPVRVSNFAAEQYLGTWPAAAWPYVSAYGYQEAGHTFYAIKFLSQTYVPTQELVYDLTTGLWHERIYVGAWPIAFASAPGFASGGPNFVGDGTAGKIWYQGITYPNDGTGNAITYIRTAPHVSDRGHWMKYPYFEIYGQFGAANPVLSYSNDGGITFGESFTLTQAANQGTPAAVPTYKRYYQRQLGRSRDRVFKVTITTSADLVRIADAYLGVEAGTEQ